MPVTVFERIEPTCIPGCFLIHTWRRADERGCFLKIFHAHAFAEAGLQTDFREQYFSVSRPGVLRGMHFQLPPHDHAKLVYCVKGAVLDAVVDLRSGLGFGQSLSFDLSAANGRVLYLAAGVAHGFYVPKEESILVYNVTTEYDTAADSGVRWDSCGVDWPVLSPTVSERDAGLPTLAQRQGIFSA